VEDRKAARNSTGPGNLVNENAYQMQAKETVEENPAVIGSDRTCGVRV
jgi:hypothetical protein